MSFTKEVWSFVKKNWASFLGAVVGFLFLVFFIYYFTTPKIDEPVKQEVKHEDLILKITVDYDRSLEETMKERPYSVSNIAISSATFPPVKNEQGKKEIVFKLYEFTDSLKGPNILASDIIAVMEKEYRPATIRELLAFAQANPSIHRQYYAISAFGSFYVGRNNQRFVAFLDKFHRLDLYRYDNVWDTTEGFAFLAVKK